MIMDYIAFLIANAFHIYIIYRFASRIFFNYPSTRTSAFSAICYYILNSVCALYFGIPLLNLATSMIGLIFLTLPCKDKIIKKFFFIILTTGLGFGCDILVYSIVNHPGYLLSMGILSNFILYLLELATEIFFVNKNKSDIEQREWLFLCLVPIGSIIMLFILDIDKNRSQELCLLCSSICLCINIIIFHFYDALSSYYDQLFIAQQNGVQLKLYENKIVASEMAEKRMNSFRHDLNNHLSMIKQMALQENNENIVSFLDNVMISAFKNEQPVYTKHKDINLLINYLFEKAISKEIHPSIHVDIPATLECNIYDLNIILSNIFDNALEAASVTNEKMIHLSIKYSKGILLIKIENSHNGTLKMTNRMYQSSKKNSNLHGYGLKNVKRVVEKYHGTIDLVHDNHTFYATIIIYI